jgi:hypothetical protein
MALPAAGVLPWLRDARQHSSKRISRRFFTIMEKHSTLELARCHAGVYCGRYARTPEVETVVRELRRLSPGEARHRARP